MLAAKLSDEQLKEIEDYLSEPDEDESIDQTITRLAGMNPLEYDQIRKDEAKRLNIRPKTLDDAVLAIRKKKETSGNLPFEETESYPEPVDALCLLNEIKNIVQKCLVCSQESATAISLWIALSWFPDSIHTAPILFLTSPEKRCGKSTAMAILNRLTCRTIAASSISPAAMFRAVELWTPTLLIDEADAFLRDNEELRGIVNSGHTRETAFVLRSVGDEHTPTRFSTFCLKAIAGIGRQADTIEDRSIIITLKRKSPEEKITRLRNITPSTFAEIRSKLARLAEEHGHYIRTTRPELPESLNDRQQDNWESMLAIASLGGTSWLRDAVESSLKLSGIESATPSRRVQLLADIRDIFQISPKKHIFTEQLILALCADAEKPWASYHKGKQITARNIAGLLREFNIFSETIRDDQETNLVAKGYKKSAFEDAFKRYLSATNGENKKSCASEGILSVTKSLTNNINNLSDNLSVTNQGLVTDKKEAKSLFSNDCYPVTDKSTMTDAKKNCNACFNFKDEFIEVVL